jgi:hypothetical protein
MSNNLKGKTLTDGKTRQLVIDDFMGKNADEETARYVFLMNMKKKKVTGYELDQVIGEGEDLQLVNPQRVSTKEFNKALKEVQGDDEETQSM